jgi:WD40 repeat protein
MPDQNLAPSNIFSK